MTVISEQAYRDLVAKLEAERELADDLAASYAATLGPNAAEKSLLLARYREARR